MGKRNDSGRLERVAVGSREKVRMRILAAMQERYEGWTRSEFPGIDRPGRRLVPTELLREHLGLTSENLREISGPTVTFLDMYMTGNKVHIIFIADDRSGQQFYLRVKIQMIEALPFYQLMIERSRQRRSTMPTHAMRALHASHEADDTIPG